MTRGRPAADFDSWVTQATGFEPYPYQRQLAAGGLPDVLRAPTGAGKTLAAVLPWLWRRRMHPDADVRDATPRRLVLALPLRTLVEQTVGRVTEWIAALELEETVAVHVLMGGEGKVSERWRHRPEAETVLVGTIDMLLSRALNRGYAMGRGSWPVDFALVNTDCQWVFDEVQLMGAALPTSRQLQAFRELLGTYRRTATMWMSATVDLAWLTTVDAPTIGSTIELDDEDLAARDLGHRMRATRRVVELDPRTGLAAAVIDAHRPGTRTIVVHNTVRRAQATYQALRSSGTDAELVLVHSRFRPPERLAATTRALAKPGAAGTIVVTTQALEAGVDVSARTLFTEAAPWPSVVQRAGRCNRYGEHDDARLVWFPPEAAAPYDEDQVAAAVGALRALEGVERTGAELGDEPVAVTPPEHLVLRRKDLVELFDTASDLSGNDVDVSRFIRDTDDIDVRLAWRALVDGRADPQPRLPDDTASPTRNELCQAPIGALRKAVSGKTAAAVWRFDYAESAWVRARRPGDVRPGDVLLTDVRFGRYDPGLGWDDTARAPVPPLPAADPSESTALNVGSGDDPLSHLGVWVPLQDHLEHTGAEAEAILAALGADLPDQVQAAVRRAAELHDIGKAHPVFQDTMRRSAADHETDFAAANGPWAKSSRGRSARHRRRHFSHELAGALALLRPEAGSLLAGVEEADLAVYLVAAHHGRVRLGIRSATDEMSCPETGGPMILGVCDGEALPAVGTPQGRLPSLELDLTPALLGGGRSWTVMALALRDRGDLGIFRLAFLEALVRIADWRASAREETGG